MVLIKYKFYNIISVCLKIRMIEYIVYEFFYRYVKSKVYYQIVVVFFLKKKIDVNSLFQVVFNFESNNYCI